MVDRVGFIEDDRPGSAGPTIGEVSRRMDFTVHTPDGADRYEGATYTVDGAGSGTLHVLTAEGRVIVYGTAGWHRLEIPAPPPPPPPPPPPSATERIEQLRQEAHQEQLEDAERARRWRRPDG